MKRTDRLNSLYECLERDLKAIHDLKELVLHDGLDEVRKTKVDDPDSTVILQKQALRQLLRRMKELSTQEDRIMMEIHEKLNNV